LAIGKEGQNARLANKLTRWKIDIKGVAGIFSSEQAVEGSEKVEKDDKVIGVWDAEIKKYNEAEEIKKKEEVVEENNTSEQPEASEDAVEPEKTEETLPDQE
jgi:N utilization substance protein A